MKNRTLYLLLIISFVSKCCIAGITELNNDEVYYWTYPQQLQWSYFDHPPMIAILLRFFSFNLIFDNEFMLRLGPIVCGTLSTWLIYLIGKKIKDETAGLIAAILFTASPYCCIIAGLLVIPDAPQLVFWLWSVLLMLGITQPYPVKKDIHRKLLLLGLTIGLCILSKIHGIFLALGFVGYIFFFQRDLFKNQYLYFSFLITAVLIFPIYWWNYTNDFITYKYQGSRVSFFGSFQFDGFFREVFGEVLYNNPINFVLLVLTCTAIVKRKRIFALASQRLLLFLSFPLIIIVLFIALFKDTLPHWTGPAYATFIPVVAAYLRSRQMSAGDRRLPNILKWALGLTVTLLIAAICLIKWLPVNIGSKDSQELGRHDVSLDMNGWKQFGIKFDSLRNQDLKNGAIKNPAFLIADYWFPAAHIDYYVARPYDMRFIAIGGLSAIHHYAWLNQRRPFLQKGDDAYFVTVSNFYSPPANKLAKQFELVMAPVAITQYRSGVAVRNFFIYRMKNFNGVIPGSGVLENN